MAEIDKFQAMEILTEKQKAELLRRQKQKKRNYIVGGIISGALVIALALVYILSATVWLLDIDSLPYVSYTYDARVNSEGENEVTATIKSYNKDLTLPANFRIPAEVNGLKVTAIAPDAFAGCKEIVHITIPDTITSIGRYAFAGCENLESFTFSKNIEQIGVGAFNDTKYVQTIDADHVTGIGKILYNVGANIIQPNTILLENEQSEIPAQYAGEQYHKIYMNSWGNYSLWADALFMNNNNIIYAEIPSTLDVIPVNLFAGCKKLEGIYLDPSVSYISNYAFDGCDKLVNIEVGETVVSIGDFAFRNTGLETIELPSQMENIGKGAFQNCKNIEQFAWPASLVSIPESVFEGCSGLSSFTFTDDQISFETINYIGAKAFKGTQITTFTVPMRVSALLEDTFKDTPLTRVNFFRGGTTYDAHGYPSVVGLQSIRAGVFNGCPLNGTVLVDEEQTALTPVDEFYLPTTLVNVTQTSGKEYTFANNENMVEFTIPLSLYSTSEFMFANNVNLKKVNFEHIRVDYDDEYSNLTSIKMGTFLNCSSLEEIVIPSSVTSMASRIFEGCTSLNSVKLPENDSFSTINVATFKDCVSLTHIDIPATVDSFKTDCFSGATGLDYIYIPTTSLQLELQKESFVNCRNENEEPLKVFLNVPAGTNKNDTWHDETVVAYWAGEWEFNEHGVPTPLGGN